MTTHACNRESEKDDYQILRLLFHSAAFEAVNGGDWEFYRGGTYPGETIITEYQCKSTGARIKAQAFDYVDGKATKHLFTFRQLCDEDDGLPKATIMQQVRVIAESNTTNMRPASSTDLPRQDT